MKQFKHTKLDLQDPEILWELGEYYELYPKKLSIRKSRYFKYGKFGGKLSMPCNFSKWRKYIKYRPSWIYKKFLGKTVDEAYSYWCSIANIQHQKEFLDTNFTGYYFDNGIICKEPDKIKNKVISLNSVYKTIHVDSKGNIFKESNYNWLLTKKRDCFNWKGETWVAVRTLISEDILIKGSREYKRYIKENLKHQKSLERKEKKKQYVISSGLNQSERKKLKEKIRREKEEILRIDAEEKMLRKGFDPEISFRR